MTIMEYSGVTIMEYSRGIMEYSGAIMEYSRTIMEYSGAIMEYSGVARLEEYLLSPQ